MMKSQASKREQDAGTCRVCMAWYKSLSTILPCNHVRRANDGCLAIQAWTVHGVTGMMQRME